MHQVMATGSNVLDKIMAHKAKEVAQRSMMTDVVELQDQISTQANCRGFSQALLESVRLGRSAVIAEVKKASPSKGLIRPDFDPAQIAKSYQAGGASCLSVLTDENYFQGSTAYFKAARKASTLPMLRKDFLLDTYQVYEARAMGADCILLIAAALNDDLMTELATLATDLGMDVLIEVHDLAELHRGLKLGMPIIGINNRNLKTFETSLNTTLDLLHEIPDEVLVVTESGIHTAEQVALMREHGVDSFLVGEAFMRAENPGEKLQSLFG